MRSVFTVDRDWLPGADVARRNIWPVAELGGGAGRAVDDDGGFVVLVGVGVVAAEGDPALAELAGAAPALSAIEQSNLSPPSDLLRCGGSDQVADLNASPIRQLDESWLRGTRRPQRAETSKSGWTTMGYMPFSLCSRFHSRISSHVMPSKKLFLWRIRKWRAGNHHLTTRPILVRRHQQSGSQPHS